MVDPSILHPIFTDEDLRKECAIARNYDVASVWVKANGKYNYTGATIYNLKPLRTYSGPAVEIKAAGGVRTLEVLLDVKEAWCSICRATATVPMMEEAFKRFGNK